MPDDNFGVPFSEDQNPDPNNKGQDDSIPDWMKEAGWQESSGAFDESKPVFDDLEDEDEIVPADIPAWLEEAAPEGFDFDAPVSTDSVADEAQRDSEAFTTEDFDFGEPSQEPKHIQQEAPSRTDKAGDEESIDIPTWLENLELDEDSQETAVAWLENMPASLRATEEDLLEAEEYTPVVPEDITEPVDELAWMDDLPDEEEQVHDVPEESAAEPSEDLVATNLIPEASEPDQIFAQEEIVSSESDVPVWLKELSIEEPEIEISPSSEKPVSAEQESADEDFQSESSMLPDWLAEMDTDDDAVSQVLPDSQVGAESDDVSAEPKAEIPDWLSGFESDEAVKEDQPEDSLKWLESLSSEVSADTEEPQPPPQEFAKEEAETGFDSIPAEEEIWTDSDSAAVVEPTAEGVSPNDDTLNTQIPDWLSKIAESEGIEIDEEISPATPEAPEEIPASPETTPQSDLEDSASWLEEITDDPQLMEEVESSESDVLDWLETVDAKELSEDEEPVETPRDSFPGGSETVPQATELETAKYFIEEKEESSPVPAQAPEASEIPEGVDDLPDWLSELDSQGGDEPQSLEDAIRLSDRDLNEAEVEFLNRTEEIKEDNADWLAKLEQVKDPAAPQPTIDIEETPEPEGIVSGGMLDRLRESEQPQQPPEESEVPQWLEDLKEEEDPQETAVLWLKQFIEQGDQVNLHDEIQRYTDELDPGDSIPKWMEDLKNEEDPQTTAMLWLEKLSQDRLVRDKPQPAREEDESDWLAELEQEEAAQSVKTKTDHVKSFEEAGDGWLSDLDIDEKLRSDQDDLPEWTSEKEKTADVSDSEEPPWMKATSPLEGDIYTDELAGQEKEVEIPDWLAGYGEGEGPEETEAASSSETETGSETAAEEEYTWLSARDAPTPTAKPVDLNKAAISQLESILGISYQVAKGIVQYREKQGPYRDFSELMNVPEIADEQTIEILKPEVYIDETALPKKQPESTPARKQPAPKQPKKPKAKDDFGLILEKARSLVEATELNSAIEQYAHLIKKKKLLIEVIEDLQKASLDHPLEIMILKTLGDAYMQSDNLDKALETYSKAEDLLN